MKIKMDKKSKLLFKVVLIGDMKVGKSSILLKYKSGIFDPYQKSTIGIDFSCKTLVRDNQQIKLQIWDTAGQERFQCIGSSYYKGANYCIVVFDLTNEKSFDNIEKWIKLFQEKAGDDIPIVLVGNKCDLEHMRIIHRSSVDSIKEKYGIMIYVETSALNGNNIEVVFNTIATHAAKKFKQCLKYNKNEDDGGSYSYINGETIRHFPISGKGSTIRLGKMKSKNDNSTKCYC